MGITEDAAAVVSTGTDINENVQKYLEQLRDSGLSAVNAVEQKSIDVLGKMAVTAYINQITGSDDNDGSLNAPLKSIQAALDRTPRAGFCTTTLQGDYHIDQNIRVDQKRWLLQSDSSVQHKLTHEIFKLDFNGSQYRSGFGIIPSGGPSIVFNGLTIEVPSAAGVFASYIKNPQGCLFSQSEFKNNQAYGVMLIGCDVIIPQDAYAPLFANTYNPLQLTVFQCSASEEPLNGNVLWGYDDKTGVSSGNIPILSTNLSTI